MSHHLRGRYLLPSLFSIFVLWFGCGAQAQSSSLLPKQFAGWQLSGNVRQSTDLASADSINAALLKEYGFSGLESATYQRQDGRKLALKVAHFTDATGAYGAFTYYLMPQMNSETIGDGAASLNERVLFHRGNLLVDAVFDRLTAMSAAELRELSNQLPLPASNLANLPVLPTYLPKENLVANSTRFIVGPIGAQKTGAPLQEPLIDFSNGAEVVIASYRTSSGESTLTLLSYPLRRSPENTSNASSVLSRRKTVCQNLKAEDQVRWWPSSPAPLRPGKSAHCFSPSTTKLTSPGTRRPTSASAITWRTCW